MIYSTPVDDVYDSGSLRLLPLGLRMAWDRGEGDDGLLSRAQRRRQRCRCSHRSSPAHLLLRGLLVRPVPIPVPRSGQRLGGVATSHVSSLPMPLEGVTAEAARLVDNCRSSADTLFFSGSRHSTLFSGTEHVYNHHLIRFSIFLLLTSCSSLRITMAAMALLTASSEYPCV